MRNITPIFERNAMKNGMRLSVVISAALVFLGLSASVQAQQADMTFFITSAGLGKGGDLGGLAGADAHCQALAQAIGAGNRTWRAYLSTNARGGANPVNARDRIGNGPWQNAKGVVIATSVADLHSDNNKIGKATAINEKGEAVKVRGDTPTMHDILTGSDKDGRAFPPNMDLTSGNWTSSGLVSPCSDTSTARAILPWKTPKMWRPIWRPPVPGMLPTRPVAAPSKT
jgi:hypothetical protein